MASLETCTPSVRPDSPSEGQAQARCRREMRRTERCALAILVGLELSVVYVIGSLVLTCVRT